MDSLSFSVSEFVAVCNQTLEYAYPTVTIQGELANFRVSKNRWVYFDLKDDEATVRFFGTVYQLPGPLEDGMVLVVKGVPRLHPQYGFSVTVQAMRPSGEGSIKKASKLLEAKLAAEGLFDPIRKRALPYPPRTIGLITSGESAAYRDFIKVIQARFGGMTIKLIDVQVQGDASAAQITAAIRQYNQLDEPPDILVITRGGGSAEDLQAFSTEQVTRAVAGSRIPTLVAIGHEIDISLAELAADQRASTPSNAAELIVPDRNALLKQLQSDTQNLHQLLSRTMHSARQHQRVWATSLYSAIDRVVHKTKHELAGQRQLLEAYSPQAALARGYALVRTEQGVVRRAAMLQPGNQVDLQFADGIAQSTITHVTIETEKP